MTENGHDVEKRYCASNFAATAQLVALANSQHKQQRATSAFEKKREIWYGSAGEHGHESVGRASAYLPTTEGGGVNDDVYVGGDAILERTAKRREDDLLVDPTELKRDPVRWCGNCENR